MKAKSLEREGEETKVDPKYWMDDNDSEFYSSDDDYKGILNINNKEQTA